MAERQTGELWGATLEPGEEMKNPCVCVCVCVVVVVVLGGLSEWLVRLSRDAVNTPVMMLLGWTSRDLLKNRWILSQAATLPFRININQLDNQ